MNKKEVLDSLTVYVKQLDVEKIRLTDNEKELVTAKNRVEQLQTANDQISISKDTLESRILGLINGTMLS